LIIRTTLLVVLVLLALVFIIGWRRAAASRGVESAAHGKRPPSLIQIAIGFVTDFFDTLGIGSFATTTTAYKLLHVVPDERVVGTMLIGHSLPVVVQAFIFLVVVQVDPVVLALLIAVSILGSWIGAGVASSLPRRPIQICMGIGLFAAASFMLMSQLGLFPGGGTALTLTAGKLVIALVANFILGALLMLGIGSYAPSLILFSVLGMDPRAAFPIMMSSGAMMAMVGGLRFMKAGRFDTRAALGLTLGGIPGVLAAGLFVRSLSLSVLQWMVVVVVFYAATMMLRSASMRHISDAVVLDDLVNRLRRLVPTQPRRWGTMNAQQMALHVGDACAAVLKQRAFSVRPQGGPAGVRRVVALYLMPRMPRGLKTGAHPAGVVVEPAAFARDLERAVVLHRQLATAAPDTLADRHPIFGLMKHAHWMRWAFLHTDHHLRQFGL
jgi:uncharacterized membrane protein YfcA